MVFCNQTFYKLNIKHKSTEKNKRRPGVGWLTPPRCGTFKLQLELFCECFYVHSFSKWISRLPSIMRQLNTKNRSGKRETKIRLFLNISIDRMKELSWAIVGANHGFTPSGHSLKNDAKSKRL